MRPLETLSLLLIGSTIYLLVFKKNKDLSLFNLFIAIISIIVYHFFEGIRWQLNFAIFILPLLYIRLKISNQNNTVVFDRIIYFCFFLAFIIPYLVPVFNLPAPRGKYNIGTESFHWEDLNRKEWFTEEDNNDLRNLMVQVWYPSNIELDKKKENYIDDIILRSETMAAAAKIPSFFPKHLRYINRNSYQNIAPANLKNKFPILIFSHGITSSRHLHQTLFEHLSSKGYVVVAPNHSYDANLTIFPNKKIANYRSEITGHPDSLNIRKQQMETRALDIVFIINQLEKIQSSKIKSRLNGLLNLDKVAIAGHSYGGATAVLASKIDNRIKSCLVLDGWFSPLPDSVISSGLNIPFFCVGRPSWEGSDYPKNYLKLDDLIQSSSNTRKSIFIKNSLHLDFTDIPLFSPIINYVLDVSSNPVQISITLINDLTFLFLEQSLFKTSNEDLDKHLLNEAIIVN